MTAFGPFAAPTVVDFDALGADGLFLLHGHTGAGKTTVLDAIAFALYGKVPGARGESKRLHSDHASPQTPPRVVLEATLGGRRLRLTRTPEFERPKLRGTGMRTEPAKATLEWLDGAGVNLARISDIGDEIIRLLGMSADQFFQVVLLPQGDFARFLRAENEEREKLLEKLFDTERFGAAEQWLLERKRVAGAELDTQREHIERLIAQIRGAAGLSATDSVGTVDAVGWSQDLLTAARTDLAAASAAVERCRAESTRLSAHADAQRRLAEQRRRMDAARQRLDDYAAGAPHRCALAAELDLARRAQPVKEAIDEARDAVMNSRALESEAHSAARKLADALLDPCAADLDGADLLTGVDDVSAVGGGPSGTGAGTATEPGIRADADLGAAILRWGKRIGALDEVRADAKAAEQLSAELAGVRSEAEAVARRMGEMAASRERLPAAIAAAEARVREVSDAAATLPALRAELERLQAATTAAVELTGRRTDLDRARVAYETARATHNDAKERVLDLRERRLSGMAAELAGQLVTGHPCKVCGSPDHPDPATPGASAVSDAAERKAAAAERAAEADRDTALSVVTGLEREIEALIARGGDTDRVELAAALRGVTARYEDAADAAEQIEAASADVTRLRTDETRLHDDLRTAEARRSALAARLAAGEARLAELTERLLAAAGADATVDARRSRLDALVAAADSLRAARAAATAAREQVTALADRVENLARAAGFLLEGELAADPDSVATDSTQPHADGTRAGVHADGGSAGPAPEDVAAERGTTPPRDDVALLTAYAAVVKAAARTPQRQREIESELTAAEHARAHAEQVLAEPESAAAATAELDDPAELDRRLHEARERLETAAAAQSEASRRVQLLQELGAQLWTEVERIGPRRRAYEELAGVADVVAGRGENNRKMSLRSYVLAARLEEVALAGSERLRRMSGGRYEFVHTDRAGRHGRRGGLGLDIRDDYTGAIRPAKTLSGGETFMASLSMALGLADTVAAESGGIALDTLFIDEGFGGLDADTLDAVMGVLDELRAGGRVVGIVSHVDEMRQRIPSRLHVLRDRTGSHLRTTVA